VSLRILILEDNATNLMLVRDLLEVRGHDVLTAASADELGSVDAMPRPDIVVMDIMLPGKDGTTLMRELRGHAGWERVPFVAVTAHAMAGDRERLLKEGYAAYIAKPIDTRRFGALIEAAARAVDDSPEPEAAGTPRPDPRSRQP